MTAHHPPPVSAGCTVSCMLARCCKVPFWSFISATNCSTRVLIAAISAACEVACISTLSSRCDVSACLGTLLLHRPRRLPCPCQWRLQVLGTPKSCLLVVLPHSHVVYSKPSHRPSWIPGSREALVLLGAECPVRMSCVINSVVSLGRPSRRQPVCPLPMQGKGCGQGIRLILLPERLMHVEPFRDLPHKDTSSSTLELCDELILDPEGKRDLVTLLSEPMIVVSHSNPFLIFVRSPPFLAT